MNLKKTRFQKNGHWLIFSLYNVAIFLIIYTYIFSSVAFSVEVQNCEQSQKTSCVRSVTKSTVRDLNHVSMFIHKSNTNRHGAKSMVIRKQYSTGNLCEDKLPLKTLVKTRSGNSKALVKTRSGNSKALVKTRSGNSKALVKTRPGNSKTLVKTRPGNSKTLVKTRSVAISDKKVLKRRINVYYKNKTRGVSKKIDRVTFHPERKVFRQESFLSNQFNRRSSLEHIFLQSHCVCVVDQHSHDFIFERNSYVMVPIASITKLMTAMVVLDSGLPLNEILAITNEDRDHEKWTSSRLRLGSKLTRADMLHIALMSSENRAASALSRYYPGGQSAFIAAMNRKARALGLSHTFFKNATGLSRQNVSTARDLVRLVEVAYTYPLIRKYSTDSRYMVHTGIKTLNYHSTNGLVKSQHWKIGIQKTGFINEAGECLVMQAVIDSRPVIMVLLNANGKYSRIGDAETIRHWLLAKR